MRYREREAQLKHSFCGGAMRLPTLERVFWTLRSGEESHRAHPDKFWIPPLEQRSSLQRGQAARLIFDIEAEDEDGKVVVNGERMWVRRRARRGFVHRHFG